MMIGILNSPGSRSPAPLAELRAHGTHGLTGPAPAFTTISCATRGSDVSPGAGGVSRRLFMRRAGVLHRSCAVRIQRGAMTAPARTRSVRQLLAPQRIAEGLAWRAREARWRLRRAWYRDRAWVGRLVAFSGNRVAIAGCRFRL